jgi:pyridoxal phosphate enzyme (YggS family)
VAVTIAERLAEVHARIDAAKRKAGREGDVALVAVSKTQPASAVREAYDAGQRMFGENYVQELVSKAKDLGPREDVRWHFIGHLQRNKVKDTVGVAHCIETIDSTRLADAVIARSAAIAFPTRLMIQVNVAREARKSGCAPEELDAIVERVKASKDVVLLGLMTIPPLDPDPERSRPHFRALAALARERGIAHLSMGMSADLEVAIEEGATIVRVGTAIFGARR